MPIDTGDKMVGLAADIVRATNDFMQAHEFLKAYRDEYANSGLTWDDSLLLQRPETKHIDGTMLDALLGSVTDVDTFVTTNGHDTKYDAVRP